ncbi:BTAD domain-containing putative transcriptional regulator [Actinomadura sp. 21ATH]|uniref:AfsR/SARP family transcriptional regulator n=1 Tax=Actinomadura sp. 21ATH TaxID=1735444 RepID=UPI0035C17106
MLGPLEIRHHGEWVDIRPSKVRAVLALLLDSGGTAVMTAELCARLWPCPPPSAKKVVQLYVCELRRRLCDRQGATLQTRAGGYRLLVEPGELDADLFEALVQKGRCDLESGAAEAAAETLREALGLWRGPALADTRGIPALDAAAARLDESRLLAVELRMRAELECGRHDSVVPELVALVRTHPFRERLRLALMVALCRSGRRSDALATARDLRRRLSDELGLTPSAAFVRTEQAIIAGRAGTAPHRGSPRR